MKENQPIWCRRLAQVRAWCALLIKERARRTFDSRPFKFDASVALYSWATARTTLEVGSRVEISLANCQNIFLPENFNGHDKVCRATLSSDLIKVLRSQHDRGVEYAKLKATIVAKARYDTLASTNNIDYFGTYRTVFDEHKRYIDIYNILNKEHVEDFMKWFVLSHEDESIPNACWFSKKSHVVYESLFSAMKKKGLSVIDEFDSFDTLSFLTDKIMDPNSSFLDSVIMFDNGMLASVMMCNLQQSP